jgi:dipeptidyl aminopeptidase/acylaminoacyl peptidase
MREFNWQDAKGRTWHGGLMVPNGFDAKVRHALVIQTYGFSPTRFYRDGSNIYDGFTSGFAGRAFLREDILVLAMPLFVGEGSTLSTRDKVDMVQDGIRAAIESLVAAGTVDRNRIGIMGWSATGEQVLNLLTFTDAPIRAASMLDGDANTLFSMTVTYSVMDGTQIRKEELNGGGPYGASRQSWIDHDPALHTDCIRAAMRIETYGPEVHNNWDIYALLRRQYKPVEMIFMPMGSHQLSRPSERMISMQGNLDWFRFWLNDAKRTQPVMSIETHESLKDQYVRWAQMAVLKAADDRKPKCERRPGGN